MPQSKLSRRSLRQDQVLEFHLAPLPPPPDAMMKLPGVRVWYEQLKLMRERDTQAMQRLVTALSSSGPVADAVTGT